MDANERPANDEGLQGAIEACVSGSVIMFPEMFGQQCKESRPT